MIWSFSSSRTFRKCQRQWYFKTHVANANAKKDPLRREAYLLSKLQSITAWRGNIVDHVISKRIIPALNNKWDINLTRVVKYARMIFEKQLEFAKQHRLREPGMSLAKAGDDFAAFYVVEYSLELIEEEVIQAWRDIEQAMINLFQMHELFTLLLTANKLISQRALTFPHYQITVRAVPDLIAFFDNDPPLIIDWKVHAFGLYDYRLQLASYAIALTRCKLHKDFPCQIMISKKLTRISPIPQCKRF